MRLFPRHFQLGDGSVGLLFDMEFEHGVVIHAVNMVAGQNEHIVRIILLDKAHILIDSVGRAAIPLAALTLDVRRKHENAAVGQVQVPRAARTDICVQFQRLILRQHADGIDAGVGAVG